MSSGGFEALKFDESASIPEIGDKDVLVKGMLPLCHCLVIESILTQ
jgi:hypothetical protein